MISQSAVIHPGVTLGPDCTVEEFAIIGARPRGEDQEVQTALGAGCVIRSHTVIYAGNRIGSKFQTGNKTNIRESNEIGENVSIGTLTVVEHHVVIGDGARIHTQAFIPEYTIIEDGCWIGPNVVITNAKYPNSPHTKKMLAGVRLLRGCIIGANSTILPGVTIGKKALIGAGSVVVRDVPPGAVVAGNPARIVRNVKEIPYYPQDE
jgi:acetyltransferase-like isoleucine patch superfamily enzyme